MIFGSMHLCNIYKCFCSIIYKVVVQVVYDGDKSDFVFWDKECLQILGVTADALWKTMQEVNLILTLVLVLLSILFIGIITFDIVFVYEGW